ncbi:hypothetical protein HGB39_27120 [Rhodococcus opacus]|nr:hypothetical protein [Rhodococcus sp. A14]NKY74966.1 hypothetical protein [Rhodococcus opacus]
MLLGSPTDAEDVLQETWQRWVKFDLGWCGRARGPAAVRDP